MCTTPCEILETAKRIASLETLTEADFRAIVSRSYYAALHGVNLCFPQQIDTRAQNSHEKIIGKVDIHGKSLLPGRSEAKQVTRDMYLFKKMRKTADYEIDDEVEKAEVNKALTLSTSILNHCNTIQNKLADTSCIF